MKKVNVDNLANAIFQQLKDYSEDVTDITKDVVDEVAKEATVIVKDNAPVSPRGKRKGKYKRSIKNDISFESITERTRVVHAGGKEYRLTHLLEKGHLTRTGGRTKAQPHFKYGDEYIEKNFEKKLVSKVQKIK